MITTGSQIRAARALAGLRRSDLAKAAGLHTNAVSYWERHEHIPRRSEPWAVAKIREALALHGIAVFTDPSPGVRLAPLSLENQVEACPSHARADAEPISAGAPG